MIHVVRVLLFWVVALPFILFLTAFVAAVADFVYASLFPVVVPALPDEAY